ncbi:MAG: ribonuclease HII [Nitrospiria bacterium]
MIAFEQSLFSYGYRRICGIDEAGRGPLAGPVVAAAVILPTDCRIPGLRDSKKLTARQRERFFEEITQKAVSFGIGIVESRTIDKINIYRATLLAMRRSVDALRARPDYLLIDAMPLPDIDICQESIIRGDDLSLSIAAASVIAKVTRDRLMLRFHTCYPAYGFDRHKGYGTRDHLEKIREYGPCRIHRKTFRGVIQKPAHLEKSSPPATL